MKTAGTVSLREPASRQKPLVGAYVILLAFTLIYFARPEDWIPGLANVPLAKLTGVLALLSLFLSLRHVRQRLPREILFLSLFIMQLFLASAFSPVWRGGAFLVTLDIAKVLIVVLVITLTVNTPTRLQWLVFIQAGSVAVIAAVSLWKGGPTGSRLGGMLGGNYGDPNDLALAIVISLPLCLALSLLSKNTMRRTIWVLAMLTMIYGIFRTGSRGGFLALVVVVALCLWAFSIQGRRGYLLVLTAVAGVILWQSSSDVVLRRLRGTFDSQGRASAAYGSALQRQQLLLRSIQVTGEHPLFGVGPGNFDAVSGNWHTAHNSFTLVSSEGGLPAVSLYLLILWCGFANLRAANRLLRGNKELKVIAGALLASLAGYLVGSFFLSVAYEFFPYVLVAYTTALLSIAKSAASPSLNRPAVCKAAPDTDPWWSRHATLAR